MEGFHCCRIWRIDGVFLNYVRPSVLAHDGRAGRCEQSPAELIAELKAINPAAHFCVCSAPSAVGLCNTFTGLHFPLDWKQSHCWFFPKRSIWKCNCLELHGGSERPDLAVNNFCLSQTHWALLSTAFSLSITSIEGRFFLVYFFSCFVYFCQE